MGRGKTRVAVPEDNLVVACKEMVPRSTEAALDFFDCASMGVQQMRGAACAQRHRLAVSRPASICGGDICAACRAGAARLRLTEKFLPPPAQPYRTRRLGHRRAEELAAAAGVRVPALALAPPALRETPAPEEAMPKVSYDEKRAAQLEAVTARRVSAAPPPPPPPPPPPLAALEEAQFGSVDRHPRGVPAEERLPAGPCERCKTPRKYVEVHTPELLRPWCSPCRGRTKHTLRTALNRDPSIEELAALLSGARTIGQIVVLGVDGPAPSQEAASVVDYIDAKLVTLVHEVPAPAPDAAPEVDQIEASAAELVQASPPGVVEGVTTWSICDGCGETGIATGDRYADGWHLDIEGMLLCPACWSASEIAASEDDCHGAAGASLTSPALRVEYVVPAPLAHLGLRRIGEAIPFGVTASHIQAAQARAILAEDPVYLTRGPLHFDQVEGVG